MCKVLNIPRSNVYYNPKPKFNDIEFENMIIKIFNDSRKNYGSRKIKKELEKQNRIVSLRRIRIIMKKYDLISNYTLKQYKKHYGKTNNDNIPNIVDRDFTNRKTLEVVVSDLTYVKVLDKWYYICIILDLFNREIIGFAAGKNKDASLVYKAFKSIKYQVDKISIFHTDRGSEFKNILIDEFLNCNNISRSLSNKGCPYDNAVAESTYKIIKTEFAFNKTFSCFEQLERELFDYVNWYNNFRIHGSLDYLTPTEYRLCNI